MTQITGKEALDLKMAPNDAEADTVREYLKKLLSTVWGDGESFSGKRPFGNSGWEYDLYSTLEEAGVTDEVTASDIIFEAIEALN